MLSKGAIEPAVMSGCNEEAPNRIATVQGFFFCAPEGIRTPNLLVVTHTDIRTDMDPDTPSGQRFLQFEYPPKFPWNHPNREQSVE